MHNLNPCQPPYTIMYQSFAMQAEADATRCCISVILLVQLSLGEWGCNKGKHGGITPPNISTALDRNCYISNFRIGIMLF